VDSESYFGDKELKYVPIGTLVQIRTVDFTHAPIYHVGIVVESNKENTETLFPSVMVYNLETKKTSRQFLGSLKVISKVNG